MSAITPKITLVTLRSRCCIDYTVLKSNQSFQTNSASKHAALTTQRSPIASCPHSPCTTIKTTNNPTSPNWSKTAQQARSYYGSYGDFQITVDQEGFYQIGNAQDDENGYRLYFRSQKDNTMKFPFERNLEVVAEIKKRIQADQSIQTIAHELDYV
jgi:hypothetical protein